MHPHHRERRVSALVAAVAPAPRAVGPIRRASRPPAVRIGVAIVTLAAAAALVLALRSREQPLVLSERSVAGMMGTSGEAPLPPEDRNIAITLPSHGTDAAVLVVVDARGKQLAKPQWMVTIDDRLEGTIGSQRRPGSQPLPGRGAA